LTSSWNQRINPEKFTEEELPASIRFSTAYAIAAMHASDEVKKQMELVAGLALDRAAGNPARHDHADQVNILYKAMQKDIVNALD